MKLSTAVIFSVISIALATPVAEPVPKEALNLDKRDVWCRVLSDTPCKSGAGTAYRTVRTIHPNEQFGVNCIDSGSPGTWDWVPGWSCWVSARETKGLPVGRTCESGVPRC